MFGTTALVKEHVPKVRFWDTLLILLGLKSAALPNISSEYEVTDLDEGNAMHFSKSPVALGRGHLSVT